MAGSIIVGTDGSPQAAKAVAWAADLANRLGAELVVTHVFETDPATLPGGYVSLPQEELDRLRTAARQKLETEWSAAAAKSGARWRTLPVDGNAAGALIDLARREGAAQIVVGSRGRGGFAEMLFGSVAQPVPVTVVPEG